MKESSEDLFYLLAIMLIHFEFFNCRIRIKKNDQKYDS